MFPINIMYRRHFYTPNYGYIYQKQSGGDLKDILEQVIYAVPNLVNAIPDSAKELIKDVAWKASKKTASAIGEKIGDKIADKIVGNKKNKLPMNDVKNLPKTEAEIRAEVLRDLKLIPDKNNSETSTTIGEGVKKKKKKNFNVY